MQSDVGRILLKLFDTFQFLLKLGNNNEEFSEDCICQY